jgi:dCMP deaminase
MLQAHLDVAVRYSKLSKARRLQVGAIVVKDNRIISIGYNGMPSGWDNNCEDKVFASTEGWMDPPEIFAKFPYEETSDEDGSVIGRYRLVTKPEVLHAESNAIAKLARSNDSGEGADLFVTHSPCIECAKLIHQSGIGRVYYGQDYRDNAGIDFLKKSGIEVVKLEQHDN